METSHVAPLLPTSLGAGASQAADQANSRNTASADFQSFLTLLTAQLRNQDPLSPLDATEFVAQLASFSSVEQLVRVNTGISNLGDRMAAAEVASLASWVGKDVAVSTGAAQATGEPISFLVRPIAAERIDAIVRRADGVIVRKFSAVPGMDGTATWDGRDALGNPVAPGSYSIELAYVQNGTAAVTEPAEVLRRVAGLRGSPDGLILDLLDGGAVTGDQVSRLLAPVSAPASS